MIKSILETISLWIIPIIIVVVLLTGIIKKLPVYEIFVEGAKDGAKVGINVFPYLLAIITAIAMLRASGAIEACADWFGGVLNLIKVPADVLPVMLVRSLSGSASLGILGDIVANHDINSYTSRLAAIMVGSSETTLYVLAVYFGAVNIKKYRYALLCGLLADAVGIIVAVIVTYKFFA